jgi:hypothetical protein
MQPDYRTMVYSIIKMVCWDINMVFGLTRQDYRYSIWLLSISMLVMSMDCTKIRQFPTRTYGETY